MSKTTEDADLWKEMFLRVGIPLEKTPLESVQDDGSFGQTLHPLLKRQVETVRI